MDKRIGVIKFCTGCLRRRGEDRIKQRNNRWVVLRSWNLARAQGTRRLSVRSVVLDAGERRPPLVGATDAKHYTKKSRSSDRSRGKRHSDVVANDRRTRRK